MGIFFESGKIFSCYYRENHLRIFLFSSYFCANCGTMNLIFVLFKYFLIIFLIGEMTVMKLLIVDDEELTRSGLISSIDWKSLGITEILQADDGVNGLEMARLHKPEIILCDVRMPRMTGIAMLERLEKLLPDSIPIFMSGYSDKEYLKAAIKLKAINYIEKPLNPSEVQDAVLEARELYMQKLRTHHGEALRSLENSTRLAYLLTNPYNVNEEAIRQLGGELSDPELFRPDTRFLSVVIRISGISEGNVPSFEELHMTVMDFLKNHHLKAIYTEKKSQYVVYFVYGSNRFSPATVMAVGNFISSQYEIYGKHMIAAGDAATGIAHAYQSYTSAVILLQSSFFFPAGTLLTTSVLENASGHTAKATWTQTPELTFSKLLSGNEKDCMQFLSDLFCFYNSNHTYMPNQVKDLYYRLFSVLYDIRKKMQLPSTGKQEAIVDILERAFTYNELHQALVSLVDTYFEDSGNSQPENSTIFQIREFISKNYMNDTLSVKDISNHVFLSASYVCTFFKSETGQTLNQYLTEYRMEKAKQLLTDPRYKISEISSKVGYTDGNYFGKSFKKYTGLSPSEYREKMS